MKLISVSRDYFGQVIGELKKVTHPTPSQIVSRTLLVVASIVAATVLITFIDAGITEALKAVLFKGE